jgi:large subunit ribosomal protein L23
MEKKVLLGKVISEKSFVNADAGTGYTFYVNPDASKVEIEKAVEKEYNVKVVDVRTISLPGKMRMDWKSRIKNRASDKKKAFVVLKKGDAIKDFVKI